MPAGAGALDEPVGTPAATCAETPDGGRVLRAATVEAEVSPTGRLVLRNLSGKLLLEEYVRNANPPRRSIQRVAAREFRAFATGGWAIAQRFESDPDERLWGMGQYQQPNLDLKGCELELVQRNSQTTVPFVVSSRGYGLLWNNPAQGSAVFGRNLMTWRATSSDRIDWWIVAGPTPAAILHAYADATGHAPSMPEWALGFWQSKCRYRTQDELMGVARRYRELGIPLSAIVASKEIMDKVNPGTIGGTYGANALAAVSALKVIEVMTRDDFPGKALHIADVLTKGFKEMQKKYPCIGDVRGTGAMMGIEFIKDEKKTPDAEIVGKIVQNAMNKGLMLEAAGTFNNVIRILCPLVATDEQLEAGLKIFEEALAEAAK